MYLKEFNTVQNSAKRVEVLGFVISYLRLNNVIMFTMQSGQRFGADLFSVVKKLQHQDPLKSQRPSGMQAGALPRIRAFG